MAAREEFGKLGPVGVAHDHQPQLGLRREQTRRPRPLAYRRITKLRLVRGVIAEMRTQGIHQAEAEVRGDRAVEGGGDRMVDQPMEKGGAEAGFGETIAVDGRDGAPAHLESEPVGGEAQSSLALPEVAPPPVVIAPDHGDRKTRSQTRQRRGDAEPAPGNHPRVGEPEVEQVAVDEEAIPEVGDGVEKGEEGFLDGWGGRSEVRVGDDDQRVAEHGAKDRGFHPPAATGVAPPVARTSTTPRGPPMSLPQVSELQVRVNYSETDQMGVVYHARYLVWLDVARTEHLRLSGTSYRDLESQGLRLVVSGVSVRYRQPARFDDVIRVRCWVREVATRRVTFGYAVEHAGDGRLLATASTTLVSLGADMRLTTLPDHVRAALRVVPDPVRLGPAETPRTQRDEP